MATIKRQYVGIDVGSKELVVKIALDETPESKALSFTNDASGHKKLIKRLTKKRIQTRVCMEATGIYHMELAIRLSKTDGVEVAVINPKVIKHFAIAAMKRAKNDSVDADTILNYLRRMSFKAWQAPADDILQLQALNRRIHQLKAEITRETCHRHATEYAPAMEKLLHRDIEVNMKHLQRRIKLLEDKAIVLINDNPCLQKKYDLLNSVKGIAKTSAIQILAELAHLPEDMAANQWVAFAGLDPRAIESGTSIHPPRRISKAGNKYLRTALYMPAWVAKQNVPQVKAFYDQLIAKGKKPLQAIVAVMRKLLHAIWGMFKTETPWDADKFYQMATP